MDSGFSRGAFAGGRVDTRPSPRGVRPIRLLIVDDSIVVRTVMSRLFAERAEFEVVAAARNVAQALEELDKASVDIILLDLQMPGIDGLTALPQLIERSQGARILIVSSHAASGAESTVRALTLGAADTLQKPGAGEFGERFADILAERLRRLGHAPRLGQPRPAAIKAETPASIKLQPMRHGPVDCIAIGASTGGIHALTALFRSLASQVDAPVLITQHLPPVFMSYFAGQMQEIAGRPAVTAVDGMLLRRGHIVVATGDAHIRLVRMPDGVRIRFDRTPQPSGCTPSVDPMLAAVADIYGPTGIGVVLSGMGRDGAIGAGLLVSAGGEVIVQDAETSVVWGMPGAIARGGNASLVAPAERLADRLLQRVLTR